MSTATNVGNSEPSQAHHIEDDNAGLYSDPRHETPLAGEAHTQTANLYADPRHESSPTGEAQIHSATMGISTVSEAASEVSTSSADHNSSPLLLLPAEIRLMVWVYIPKTKYNPLPGSQLCRKDKRFLFWPCISMPTAPSCISRQLYSELQAHLLEIRLKSELPDIVVKYGPPRSLLHLLGRIDEIAEMDNLSKEHQQETLHSMLPLGYGHRGDPVEGPKNLPQQRGTVARYVITPAQGNTNRPSISRLVVPTAPAVLDAELLHKFVCAVVARLRAPGNYTVHVRIVLHDYWFKHAANVELLGRILVPQMLDQYKVKISVSRAGGFGKQLMKKIEHGFPPNTVSRIDWLEATEEELAICKPVSA